MGRILRRHGVDTCGPETIPQRGRSVGVSGYAGATNQVLTATGYGATWANLETYYNYVTIGLNTTGISSAQGGDLRLIYYTSTDADTVDLSTTPLYSQFTSTKESSLSLDANGNLSLTV